MVGRNELDGFRIDMSNLEGYLKKLVLLIRILIMTVLPNIRVRIVV